MALSRWSDDTGVSMDEIIEKMINFEQWHEPIIDPLTQEKLLFTVNKSFTENKVLELNGTKISYNVVNYEYEKIRAGEETNEMRSSRIYSLIGYVVIYTDGLRTQYITNRSNNDSTKTILRKLNNYTGQLEIKSNPFQITEDLFLWMIAKILNNSNESIDETSQLTIKKIVGFKGSSDDRLAEVVGSGNRIMNALSTLAFLFENDEVTYVKPVIEYEKHTIELFLNLGGSMDINFENYVGDFFMDPSDELKAKVTLMVSLETIPKIIASYGNDSDWSVDSKINLITEIGESIQAKVKEKIRVLKEE